ncbi:hypothetical protein [Ruminococcus sp. 5_1_39BFAA]|uniref:DUF7666 domain-containing protein n=1 Tax=Ruminococcus sp. 5_1_39BFAA TaxID=457412 RepID=UPI00356972A9
MIAYKGLEKDLTCRGYQFFQDRINVTEKANCAQNGFHCAENPLDCLCYYHNWRDSVYYVVRAEGDIDEDGMDSKISCTHMTLLKKLSMQELLLHALAYMVRYPGRKWNGYVQRESGKSKDGFTIVRGKCPRASGKLGDILALAKEIPDTQGIQEVALFVVDGETYLPNVWYDVKGTRMDEEAA